MSLQDRLLKRAESHGFRCYRSIGESIVVCIDWIDANTKTTGFEKFVANTLQELDEIMGY
jgi:hypothetical protein